MAYVVKRFLKIIMKHGCFQKIYSTNKITIVDDLYHKCNKHGHFMRDFPCKKQETYDNRHRKKDLVKDHARRNYHEDHMVIKTFLVCEMIKEL